MCIFFNEELDNMSEFFFYKKVNVHNYPFKYIKLILNFRLKFNELYDINAKTMNM